MLCTLSGLAFLTQHNSLESHQVPAVSTLPLPRPHHGASTMDVLGLLNTAQAEGQLGYFQDWGIMNKAATNTSIKGFLSSGINAQWSRRFFFIFDKVQFIISSFIDCTFGVENNSPSQTSQRFSTILLPKCAVFLLTVNHFELDFVEGVGLRSGFLGSECLIVPAVFPLWHHLWTFVKNQRGTFVGIHVCMFFSVPVIYVKLSPLMTQSW